MIRLTLLILALGVLIAPALAEDDPAAQEAARKEAARQKALKRQAKVSIDFFRKAVRSRNIDRKMMALLEMGRVKHDLVIAELGGKYALRSRSEDLREGAASLLGDMDFNPQAAGDCLKAALPENDDFPDIQVLIIRSIAKLRYKDALEELKEAAAHLNEEKYRWVTVEVVRTFGVLEDSRALPYLLWMAEYGGKVLKWATGSVTVDTGAAGTVDQEAAEKAWHQKYGHIKPKKPPAPLIRTYMQHLRDTVKKITGQEFEDATKFRVWLIAHAEDYGLDPRELSK